MKNRTYRNWRPGTYNEKTRSVKATIASESPTTVFDYAEYRTIQEILCMKGVILPDIQQIPFLDSHQNGTVRAVLGSCRNIRIEGDSLSGDVFFSDDHHGETTLKKVRDGHLTDLSVGYRVLEFIDIPPNQSQIINGKSYQGPVRVSTSWELMEVSATPIGADSNSKFRSEDHNMSKEITDQTTGTETPEQIRQAAVVQERERVASLSRTGAMMGCEELTRRLIEDGTPIQRANEVIIQHIQRVNPPVGSGRIDYSVGEYEGQREAAWVDGLVMKAGFSPGAKSAPGAETFRSYSMVDIAKDYLENSVNVSTRGMSNTRVIEKAMTTRMQTTSDFPEILANVGNKVLRSAYEHAPSTFETWTVEGEASDFKELSRVQLSEAPDLEYIAEAAEYQHGSFGESKEVFAIKKYGKMFKISWESLVNDDLGAFSRIARAFTLAAKRGLNRTAYNAITANPVMSDGKTLFHTDHGNLAAGTDAGALAIVTLSAARKAMRLQTGLQTDSPLNISPKFLIVPASLETDADGIVNTMLGYDPEAGPGHRNPFYQKLTVVTDPTLDISSAVKWYLAADPTYFDTVEIAYLDGVKTPYIEDREGWETDSWEFKIRFCYGVKALDWRGLYCNPGE